MGIGPSTKETSLHHFRDPLVDIVGSDEGIDLMGVLLFGTADDNVDKIRNSTRAAIVAECMRADGVRWLGKQRCGLWKLREGAGRTG